MLVGRLIIIRRFHWLERQIEQQKAKILESTLIILALRVPWHLHLQRSKRAETSKNRSMNARLQEEFINATKDYKSSLGKLLATYERDGTKAEAQLTQSQALFAQGLIAKTQLNQSESAVAAAKDKVAETNRLMTNADTQIAHTLLEARAEAQLAKTRIAKGGIVRTTSYIRYAGAGSWLLSESWKVQRFSKTR